MHALFSFAFRYHLRRRLATIASWPYALPRYNTIIMATMMRPLVALAIFLWTLVAALQEQPVCLNTDGGACGDDIKNEVQDSAQPAECALWFYDYWVLAGKDYAKNETVSFQDVVVPFHQHDRRGFPLWGRYNYFRQVPNKPYHFLFAPALLFPLECHHSVPNLHLLDPIDTESFAATTRISPPVLTDHIMKKGDPFVLPCLDPAHTTEDFVLEIPTLTDEVLQSDGFCLDTIETRPSSEVPGTTLGAFARRSFAEGDVVMQGTALHMHRSELYNAQEDTHEELLNYCYGHPDTDLLLLPLAPVVNSINHASAEKTNVAIAWDMEPSELAEVFYRPTRLAFGDSEDTKLNIVFVATREIQPGEELFMDYGAAWTKAWEERDESKPFRHEIGFDLFPADWLAKEERGADFPAFATPKLAPGEAAPLQLVSGEILTEHIHRIGLPDGLTVKLAEWAEEIGITDIMRKFMFGRELAIDGQERVRINGGNWWLKRFDNSWQSNLFCEWEMELVLLLLLLPLQILLLALRKVAVNSIFRLSFILTDITPDDDEANEQFMHALGRVGWDQVLEGMGKKFGVKTLSNFYPSFIALTQSQYSYMHSDSDYRFVQVM